MKLQERDQTKGVGLGIHRIEHATCTAANTKVINSSTRWLKYWIDKRVVRIFNSYKSHENGDCFVRDL